MTGPPFPSCLTLWLPHHSSQVLPSQARILGLDWNIYSLFGKDILTMHKQASGVYPTWLTLIFGQVTYPRWLPTLIRFSSDVSHHNLSKGITDALQDNNIFGEISAAASVAITFWSRLGHPAFAALPCACTRHRQMIEGRHNHSIINLLSTHFALCNTTKGTQLTCASLRFVSLLLDICLLRTLREEEERKDAAASTSCPYKARHYLLVCGIVSTQGLSGLRLVPIGYNWSSSCLHFLELR